MINIFYKNKYMKTLMKPSFFLLSAVLACTNLHAQTADEIVNHYVAAIGGKSAVESIKTLHIESDAEVQGMAGSGTTSIINGKAYKFEMEFAGQKFTNCVSDKGGWTINPMTGSATAQPMPEEQLKMTNNQASIGGPLYDYAAKGNKVELAGQDSADYQIKLTSAAGVGTFYINKKTYYLDKTVSNVTMGGQEMEITVSFSDYRKLDGGFAFAFSQSVTQPSATLNFTHKKVEVNKPIDPAIFDMPK
jgi:hypothetical protein